MVCCYLRGPLCFAIGLERLAPRQRPGFSGARFLLCFVSGYVFLGMAFSVAIFAATYYLLSASPRAAGGHFWVTTVGIAAFWISFYLCGHVLTRHATAQADPRLEVGLGVAFLVSALICSALWRCLPSTFSSCCWRVFVKTVPLQNSPTARVNPLPLLAEYARNVAPKCQPSAVSCSRSHLLP
jgi:hypothetical protein